MPPSNYLFFKPNTAFQMKRIALGCFAMFFMLFRCANPVETDGEALAQAQCSSSHALPSPSDLDKATWDQYVLPRMGALMGVLPLDSAGGQFIEPAALVLANPSIIRKKASISKEEWAAIRRYFLENAPAGLPAAALELEASLPQFETRFPEYFLSPPGTLLAQFDGTKLFISDVHKSQFFSFDPNLELRRTAKLADLFDHKKMLTWGMALQGLALLGFIPASQNWQYITLSALLGLGTAVVYPTFLAAIAGLTHPQQRAESIGVFRLWRDLGYAIGALLTGLIADSLGLEWSVAVIGGLTILSALVIFVRMKK